MTQLTESLQIVLVGISATATLDLWALALNRGLSLPITNWAHVGRWVAGIPAGTFRHEHIAAASPVAYERALGWSTHYVIGIVYAALYLTGLAAMSRSPSMGSALAFGAATVLAPWLILQPGLGLGFFAANSPKPNLTRALNVIAHLVFGIGLYVAWMLID